MRTEETDRNKLLKAVRELRKRFKKMESTKKPGDLPGEYLIKYGDHLENLVKEQNNELQSEKSGRKRAEKELKISEEKYRTLVENVNDIVYSVNNEGIITFMSPQILKYGWTPEEATSKNIQDFIYLDDQDHVLSAFQRTMKTGEESPTKFRVKDKNGTIHWFEEKGKVQHDDTGKIIGLTGVLRDITKNKEIESELEKSEEKYRLLFESSPDSIAIIDTNGIIIDCNSQATKISGILKENLIGRPFTELEFIDEENLNEYFELFTAFLDGKKVGPFEVNIKSKKGKEKKFRIFPSIIRSEEGIFGVQIITRDITK